jgi:PleD family two-component response regulator
MQMSNAHSIVFDTADVYIEHLAAFSQWQKTKAKENTDHMLRARQLRLEHRQPLIVVVDDEPVVAITLSEILRRHGANVTWFTEPLLALAYIASGPSNS